MGLGCRHPGMKGTSRHQITFGHLLPNSDSPFPIVPILLPGTK